MSSPRNIPALTRLSKEEEVQLMNRVASSGLTKSEYMRRQLLGTGEMADIYRNLVKIRDILKANQMDHANTLIIDMARVILSKNRFKA
jgi:hypothetical protein